MKSIQNACIPPSWDEDHSLRRESSHTSCSFTALSSESAQNARQRLARSMRACAEAGMLYRFK